MKWVRGILYFWEIFQWGENNLNTWKEIPLILFSFECERYWKWSRIWSWIIELSYKWCVGFKKWNEKAFILNNFPIKLNHLLSNRNTYSTFNSIKTSMRNQNKIKIISLLLVYLMS